PVIVREPVVVKQPVIVRDHRDEGWNHIRPIPAPIEVSLPSTQPRDVDYLGTFQVYGGEVVSQPTRLLSGREDFWIGADKGQFNTVDLHGLEGDSSITKIALEFPDHSVQTTMVNQTLA